MKRGTKGFSLAEILVSILLTSIVALGVVSVTLSTKRSGSIANDTLIGSDAARALADQLKRYVTPDPGNCFPINQMGFVAPGCGSCAGVGPCSGGTGWEMPGDTGPNNSYALNPGWHEVTNSAAINNAADSYLPPQLAALAAAGRANLCYCVGAPIGPNPNAMLSSVTITMSWCPPGQQGCAIPSCSQICP